jgi:hypothetical protein
MEGRTVITNWLTKLPGICLEPVALEVSNKARTHDSGGLLVVINH